MREEQVADLIVIIYVIISVAILSVPAIALTVLLN